jgi:hypothetical protein
MPEAAASFNQAVEALYGLSVGIIGQGAERHERPHKPLLLLAVLDLIAQGRATPDRVVWCRSVKGTVALAPAGSVAMSRTKLAPGVRGLVSQVHSKSPVLSLRVISPIT